MVCAFAAALILTAAPAATAKKRHVAHRVRQPAGQIACTINGCHRIPPQCHPEMGYSWDGIPTGFDIVVCPR